MKLNKIIEIVRIKQEIREGVEAYTSLLPNQMRSLTRCYCIHSSLDSRE